MYRTENRAIAPSTVAILDYLLAHPHATPVKTAQDLHFTRKRVYSVMYQYGFINSDVSIEKFPNLWPIGEEIRQRWAAQKTAKLITEQPTKLNVAKPVVQKKPNNGQMVLREMIKQSDSDEMISLKAEVAYLRHVVAYLETQRDANAV